MTSLCPSTPEPPTALVRINPPLLADLLAGALRRRGMTVAVCPVTDRRARSRSPRRFTVALTSVGLPADALADVEVRLPSVGEGAPNLHLIIEVRRGEQWCRERVQGVDGLLELVWDRSREVC